MVQGNRISEIIKENGRLFEVLVLKMFNLKNVVYGDGVLTGLPHCTVYCMYKSTQLGSVL